MYTAKTNDLKKGARVAFHDGRTGTLMDSKRGNIRCVAVDGPHPEMGDCYMHDLVCANIDGRTVEIELTPAQVKLRDRVANMWG